MGCCNGNMRDRVGIHILRVRVRNDWVLGQCGEQCCRAGKYMIIAYLDP